MTNFSYFKEVVVNANLEIDDIGNCCIKTFTDTGYYSILIIKTVMGESTIFTYGPLLVDFESLPKEVNCNITRIEYNPKKIYAIIDKFINSKDITQAMEIENPLSALKDCRSLISYMENMFNVSIN